MRNFLTLCALVVSSALVYAQAPVAAQAGDAAATKPEMKASGADMKAPKGLEMKKTVTREEAIEIINGQLVRIDEMKAKLAEHESRLHAKLAEVNAAAAGSEINMSDIFPPRRPGDKPMMAGRGQNKNGFGPRGEQPKEPGQPAKEPDGQTPPPPPPASVTE